jgi:hypothetical protein
MRKAMLLMCLFAMSRLYAVGGRETVSHRVQPHENLFRISLMYNSTVDDIVRANPGLVADKVRSYTTIQVPKDTKIRDAAFVAALLHGKKAPIHNQEEANEAAQAQAMQTLSGENPFTAPKPRKSVAEMDKESALENNVSQKTLNPGSQAPPIATVQTQKARIIKAIDNIPASLSVYDQYAALTSLSAPDAPPPVTALTVTQEASSKAGQPDCTENAEILDQLHQLIASNQIISINLQIVMKDGSVKTISTAGEQKKILSQLINDTAAH